MFKRKRKSLEYDDDFLPPLPSEYGEIGDSSIKKRKQGCMFALVGIVVLLVCSFFGHKAYQRSIAMRPLPIPTFPPDDGKPVAVESGLVFAEYAVNGQQTGIFDLDGQAITSDTVPVSLPVSTAENPLDGLNTIAYPEGAFYDTASGQLVVFGPPVQAGASTSRDDFLTALRAVYAGEYPGVSIDPADSQTVQNVRYIGQTENTHFGWVMFEADRLMKTLSMGQDNITGASVTSSVPGFANMFDLELQLGGQNQNEVRRRFWFKVPSVEIEQTPDGQGMSITALSLAVETEYLDANWQTSKSQPPDPAGQAFAAHLTNHYDEYVVDFPVFNELKAVARWTALAHWLQQADLPIQPELWLIDSPSAYGAAPLTTPAITATRQSQQGNIIQTLILWGGVSLDMTPKIQPAQEATLGRLQEVTNRFKAWTGIGSMEISGQGMSFAPVSSSQLEHDAVPRIDVPIPLSPPVQYSADGWKLHTPHLTKAGAGATSTFLFNDPADRQPVALSHYGVDPDTGADVFVNKERGLRLAIYADGYQLISGEFDASGKFSYYENDYLFFDLQGNILQDMKTGASYTYKDGALTNVQQGGQDLKVSLGSDGQVQKLQSGGQDVNFIYENGLLASMQDASRVTIRRFTYDTSKQLTSEIGANGEIKKLFRYDADRLLYKIEDGNPVLYDWHEDGTLTQVSGKALLPWQNADVKDLQDLKVMLRLRRDDVAEQILFTRKVDDKLVVTVNDQSYTFPADVVYNPPALRRKLAAALGQNDQSGQMVLISGGDVQGVAFQALYKNAIPLMAENMDEARIRNNIKALRVAQGFRGSSINGVPEPGTTDNPEIWWSDQEKKQSWKGAIDELFTKSAFGISSRPATPEQIQKALSEDLSVLIVVAHSDGQDIYLPNGVKFNPDELSSDERAMIAEKKPLVILLSCDTATRSNGETSFAQKLLEAGPKVVIAPNGKLAVQDAHDIVKSFLENDLTKTDALQSFFEAVKKIYPDWLIPNKDGKDHSFEFHVQTIPLVSQESTT